jgi:streptogramin lyase
MIASGPDGRMWFTEPQGRRLGTITPAGAITEFALPDGVATAPNDVTSGPDGNVWYTGATSSASIGRMAPDGSSVATFDMPSGFCGTFSPLTAGPDHELWFAACDKIGRMTTAGVTTATYSLGDGHDIFDLTVAPDGTAWATEVTPSGTRGIARISAGGSVTEYPLPAGHQPVGITTGPDGNVWFTDAVQGTAGSVGRITPAGAITEFAVGTGLGTIMPGIASGPDGNIWFTLYSGIGRLAPGSSS